MIRKIIHIDEDKCNGCGLCATACHEGAIDIIDGKAKLVRENFCDNFYILAKTEYLVNTFFEVFFSSSCWPSLTKQLIYNIIPS